jgi:hypothetical protein
MSRGQLYRVLPAGPDRSSRSGPGRLVSFGRQHVQVRLRELDQLFPAAGQDCPGRVQGQALDLAESELGRQGELVPGRADVDQGRPVVLERRP